MSLKNQTNGIYPWDYQIGDDNFQFEPWILRKGKEYVTIEKNIDNKGFFIYKRMKKNVFLLTLYKQNLHLIN